MKLHNLLVVSLLLGSFCYRAQTEEMDTTSSGLSFDEYRSDVYKRSAEFMFFPRFGIGFRYRSDLGKLTTDHMIYAMDDQQESYEDLETFPYRINDTAIFVINEFKLAGEWGLKEGVSIHSGLFGAGLAGIIGIRKNSKNYLNKYASYSYDTLSNQFLYHQSDGSFVTNPSAADFHLLNQGYEILKYLKTGIAPSLEIHIRKERLIVSAQLFYEITYNLLLSDERIDDLNIFGVNDDKFWDFRTRFYLSIGRKF